MDLARVQRSGPSPGRSAVRPWRRAWRRGANRTFLVPAVLAQVLQSGDDEIALFGRLKAYCYGAAPMPPPLLRAALNAWPTTDFVHVYGLTEMCGVITNLLPQAHRDAEHPERLLSAGQVIPEAEVRVVDPDSLQELPVGVAASYGSAHHS